MSKETTAVEHFMRNAWEPIAVPRWAITLKYVLFAAGGFSTYFSGILTLDLTTPDGYVAIWATVVAFGATIGAVGSLRPKWGWIEAIGATIVFLFLGVLTFLIFARGSWGGGFFMLIVTVIPGVRAFFLVTRIALSLVRREDWRL